jgi:uncharacterized protein (TIGR02246 family)
MSDRIDRVADDETEIRDLERAYDRAWNGGEVTCLIELFTVDAVIVNPRGEMATGRAEIRWMLGQFLNGLGHGSTHASMISTIQFLTPEVAVVDGDAIIRGIREVDESKEEHVRHRFTDICVRTTDGWRIAQVRAYR